MGQEGFKFLFIGGLDLWLGDLIPGARLPFLKSVSGTPEFRALGWLDWEGTPPSKPPAKPPIRLGVDSPFFSSIVLFESRISGKNGERYP